MSATCDCRVGGSERAAYRAQRRSNKTVSESDAQSNCGIDVVALKIAVSQSAIHFREHQPGVEIPLRGKLPIDNAGDRVKRTAAPFRGSPANRPIILPGCPRWSCLVSARCGGPWANMS